MTDPQSPSPEEEARLRALLADARVTEPTPPEVVARLDATLADLAAERSATPDTPATQVAPVTPIGHHRRRRTLAGLVAAAAAVVVVGVGIGQVVQPSGSDDASTAGLGAGEAERDALRNEESAAQSEARPGAAADQEEAAPPELDGSDLQVRRTGAEPAAIGQRQVREDALAVREALPPAVTRHWRDGTAPLLLAPDGFECGSSPWGEGVLVGVTYRRDHAILAFRPPTKQNQVAAVLQCGTGEVLRSVTLPAP